MREHGGPLDRQQGEPWGGLEGRRARTRLTPWPREAEREVEGRGSKRTLV